MFLQQYAIASYVFQSVPPQISMLDPLLSGISELKIHTLVFYTIDQMLRVTLNSNQYEVYLVTIVSSRLISHIMLRL